MKFSENQSYFAKATKDEHTNTLKCSKEKKQTKFLMAVINHGLRGLRGSHVIIFFFILLLTKVNVLVFPDEAAIVSRDAAASLFNHGLTRIDADKFKIQNSKFNNHPATAKGSRLSVESSSGEVSSSSASLLVDPIIEKLWAVETNCGTGSIIGDGGKAVGPMQIHQCVIKDVNKFYGLNFSAADRNDLAKSKLIAKLYIRMWFPTESTLSKFSGQGGKFADKSRARLSDEEIAVRIYNGGPRGWRSEATNKYWDKYKSLKLTPSQFFVRGAKLPNTLELE